MAIKEFGTHTIEQTDPHNYAAEMQELAGAKFPVLVTVANGELVGVGYETEWKEGSTIPTEDKKGNITYKEDYTSHKLTAAQIKKLDAYITDNLKTQ